MSNCLLTCVSSFLLCCTWFFLLPFSYLSRSFLSVNFFHLKVELTPQFAAQIVSTSCWLGPTDKYQTTNSFPNIKKPPSGSLIFIVRRFFKSSYFSPDGVFGSRLFCVAFTFQVSRRILFNLFRQAS